MLHGVNKNDARRTSSGLFWQYIPVLAEALRESVSRRLSKRLQARAGGELRRVLGLAWRTREIGGAAGILQLLGLNRMAAKNLDGGRSGETGVAKAADKTPAHRTTGG